MSHHRDLKNAQQALNEAVETLLATGEATHRPGTEPEDFRNAYDDVGEAWQAFSELQAQFGGGAPASARDTSIAAANENLPRRFTLRAEVCKQAFAAGLVTWSFRYDQHQGGVTCDELEHRLHRTHQSVSSAVNYAESHGWIKDAGVRRLTRSASKAIVFEPTNKLIKAIAKERRVA